ncbi:MAG: FtsQ-type POTRA domain-containing protein, partial [Pseudomonadota bacterium]|nr:FtsQ-type POTRA domain-containing protein [Pseudomonadota bacterium]
MQFYTIEIVFVRLKALIANKRLSVQAARKSAPLSLRHRVFARLEQNLFWWKTAALTTLSVLFLAQLGLWLSNAQTLPIKLIRIEGQHYTSPQQLKALVSGIQGGGFSIDLMQLETRLLNLPWITTLQIHRQWPATLVIQIQERQPLARWQSPSTPSVTEALALVDTEGQLFTIPFKQKALEEQPLTYAHVFKLPLFNGLSSNLDNIFLYYQKINTLLSALDLSIQELGCNARRAWYIVLTNGIKLLLGAQDSYTSLQRFTQTYPHILETQKKA